MDLQESRFYVNTKSGRPGRVGRFGRYLIAIPAAPSAISAEPVQNARLSIATVVTADSQPRHRTPRYLVNRLLNLDWRGLIQ